MFEYYKNMIIAKDIIFFSGLVLMWLSALIISISVIYKFIKNKFIKKEKIVSKNQFIETFTMGAVIIIILNVLQLNIFVYQPDVIVRVYCLIYGLIFIIISLWMHIKAKIEIGKFWSNQIEIIQDHKMITTGVYSTVRHPMYSSLIIWLFSLDVIFLNYSSFILTIFLFIPMMFIRAKNEDKELQKIDKTGYSIYSNNVKLLLPGFDGQLSIGLRLVTILFIGYSLIFYKITVEIFIFLFVVHFITGLIISIPKVRFSFINKSFIMLIFFIISLFVKEAVFLFYIIVFFDLYGLFFNCPCMWLYEKFNGCPCIGLLKNTFFNCKIKK